MVDPARVNSAFLWLAGSLLGVPGASAVAGRLRRSGTTSADASDQ